MYFVTITRILTNIISPKLKESTNFYTQLFELTVQFESDWFVQLVSEKSGLEIGLLIANHELVPAEFQGQAAGFYLTLVVDNTTKIYNKAQAMGVEILQAPAMTNYGQLRMLIKDPAGALIDVSSIA